MLTRQHKHSNIVIVSHSGELLVRAYGCNAQRHRPRGLVLPREVHVPQAHAELTGGEADEYLIT